MEKKERARATAPVRDEFIRDLLHWKFPSDGWFGDLEAVTNLDRLVPWLQNFKVNLDTIGFRHAITDLPPIKGSALIVDKSMASTKYFEQLPEIKNYKGTIICCDRAIYTLIEHRLPEYVCNLDSSPLCLSFFDRPDVKKVMDKITAVFAVTTNPLTIRHWHGTRTLFCPFLGSMSLTKALMLQSGMPYTDTGGQVACFAWLLALNLGANPIGVFGVTHSYDRMGETEYPDVPHERKTGKYGVCWQDPVYNFYNRTWLNYVRIAKKEGIRTINTTKAGLFYSEDVEDMTLAEFVKMNDKPSE